MPYVINRTNVLSPSITVEDNLLNTTSTSLSLPGPNYRGFGDAFNTNFVKLVENFAKPDTPPDNPIQGQMWFDTNTYQMRVCPADGVMDASKWITLSSVSPDVTTELLTLIVTGQATFNSNVGIGSGLQVDGDIYATNITASANINSNTIQADVSIIPTHTVVNQIFAGTDDTDITAYGTMVGTWKVKNSLSVVSANNVESVVMNDDGIRAKGFFLADGSDLTSILTNQVGYSNDKVYQYLQGESGTEDVVGTRFSGDLNINSITTNELRSAAVGSVVYGTWTLATGARFQSTYADIAERYHADAEYDVGTVVEIGGINEVTICNTECSDAVFGIVSNSAAHLLNNAAGDDSTHPPIALIGRVPVKVFGTVKKGDRLISAGHGCARVGWHDELTPFNVIGRALEDKSDVGIALVMVATLMVR